MSLLSSSLGEAPLDSVSVREGEQGTCPKESTHILPSERRVNFREDDLAESLRDAKPCSADTISSASLKTQFD
jgi:hypothetical protein